MNHDEVPVNDFYIPSGYFGNDDPAAGTMWRSLAPAPPPQPILTSLPYQPRDPYGQPIPAGGSISGRIRNLVGDFTSPMGVGRTGIRNTTPGYVPSMSWNGAGRPVGSVVSAPKSASVQTGIGQAQTTNAAADATAAKSLSDWTKEFLASRPRAQQFADEETAAIGSVYGTGAGSTQGNLARIRNNARLALRDQTEAAIRRAGRTNSLRRLSRGGVNSSYLDRAYGQDLQRIMSQGATQDADREREDLLYLEGQRTGRAGTRQQLMDRLLERNLMPASVESGMQSDRIGRLGGIANLEYGNNVYAPAEDAYARRINFLNSLMEQGYEV